MGSGKRQPRADMRPFPTIVPSGVAEDRLISRALSGDKPLESADLMDSPAARARLEPTRATLLPTSPPVACCRRRSSTPMRTGSRESQVLGIAEAHACGRRSRPGHPLAASPRSSVLATPGYLFASESKTG